MYKLFDPKLHEQTDVPAREAAKAFWQQQGYKCEDNADEYGVDLVVSKDGKRFYCEVEVKLVWHGLDFKWDTVHIPVRKAKFLHKPTMFMLFNHSLTRAAIINRQQVLAAPVSKVANNQIAFGEKFFDVPVSEAIFVPTVC